MIARVDLSTSPGDLAAVPAAAVLDASTPDDRWYLLLEDGSRIALEHDLVLGRHPETPWGGWFAGWTNISRRHARITRDGHRWVVTDLASLNGTYLNGSELEADRPTQLLPGDVLKLGADCELTVLAPDDDVDGG